MNWTEYVGNVLKSSEYTENPTLCFADDCGQYELPPISFISNLVINILINNGNSSSVIIMPERGILPLLTVMCKLINDIIDDKIGKNYDIHSFEVGQKLKLGNCVMEFAGIKVSSGGRAADNQMRFWVKFSDRTTYGLPLSAVPFLQKTETNRLSPSKTFETTRKQYKLNLKNDVNSELKNFKTFLPSSVFYVGSIVSAKIAINAMKLNDEHLIDLLLFGKTTSDGNVVNVTAGQLSGNSAVIFSSELYSVDKAIKNGAAASSVFIDMSSIIFIESQMDALDSIKSKGIPIVIFTDSQNSFEIDCLRQRGFWIWNWNESTITTDLISEDDTKIDRRIFNYMNLKVDYILCAENEISESIRLLYSCRNDVDNQSIGLISTFYELFDISFKLLHNCILFTEIEKKVFQSKIDNCRELLRKEKNYISPKLHDDITQVISHLSVAIVDECSNLKVFKIKDLLLKDSCNGEEIILVVDDKSDKTIIQEYWNMELIKLGKSMRIFSTSEFIGMTPNKTDLIIITGWFSKVNMKKILYSFNVNKYFILLYKCETVWKNAHTKLWNTSSINDNEKILSSFFNCVPNNAPIKQVEDGFELDNAEKSTDFSEDIELILRESKYCFYSSKDYSKNNETVEAIPVNFIGDYVAFFKQSHKLLRLTDAILDDSDDASEILPKSLQIGDFIAIRDSERELAKEKGCSILQNSGRRESLELAALWKEALRIESVFSSEEEIFNNLRAAGCTKDRMTIRSWLKDEDRIAPREKADIIAIAIATGDQVLLEKADEVFEAAQDVKRAHIQAGKYLSEKLRKKVVEELRKHGNIDPFNIWDPIEIHTDTIGTFKILKVIDVGSPMLVNEININRLLKS